jgi:phosphoglycerate dehydrogenase-like enzyme
MGERTRFPRSALSRLPNLRLLVTTGRRNASIDVAAAAELGLTVCGTGSRPSGPVELTWALILAVARHVPQEDASVRLGGWQETVGTDLAGATLGLVGLGRLGEKVARIGRAFGMDVVAWSPNLTDERAAEVGVRRVDRDELLRTGDVVTVHLVLSDRTRGLIGRDEAAFLDALTTNEIAGAGLDVFDQEPLPADHPLRTAPRAVLAPTSATSRRRPTRSSTARPASGAA